MIFKFVFENGFGIKEGKIEKKDKTLSSPSSWLEGPNPLSPLAARQCTSPPFFALWPTVEQPAQQTPRPSSPPRAPPHLSGWRAGPTPSFTASRVPRDRSSPSPPSFFTRRSQAGLRFFFPCVEPTEIFQSRKPRSFLL